MRIACSPPRSPSLASPRSRLSSTNLRSCFGGRSMRHSTVNCNNLMHIFRRTKSNPQMAFCSTSENDQTLGRPFCFASNVNKDAIYVHFCACVIGHTACPCASARASGNNRLARRTTRASHRRRCCSIVYLFSARRFSHTPDLLIASTTTASPVTFARIFIAANKSNGR